ncbi:MAG: selenocysteine-specific translation elongation factor [Desulfovibrio sp.]|nr:selenocysteine-specific translation elongation factor [Desulfovibrio sp.]
MPVILGTAGHIDHGKTSLIRALTTIDCDRLQEEKKRGITIDLGFAWLDLPRGDRLGIIDVPGHERFVRTMVAGACGIDMVMLVIAADEGIMPQTREHLEICSLLGVKRGLVAITKIDMVDVEWLEMIKGEIASFLHGTFLEGSDIYPVSAHTSKGIEDLKNGIIRLAEENVGKKVTDIFRLPVDRVFTLHGHGTVVTGTVLSGTLSAGSAIVCMPGGTQSRARSIQRHGANVEEIGAGCRCAINLQGLLTEDVQRGQFITKPGELFPSTRFFLSLKALPSSPLLLKQRGEIHFHHGTKECSAKLIFRDRTTLAPGEEAFCEAVFSEELCGIFGDPCVLRSSSPLRTVAGATILSPCPPLWGRKRKDTTERIADWLSLPEKASAISLAAKKDERIRLEADFLHTILKLHGLPGAHVGCLRVLSALSLKDIENALSLLASKGQAVLWSKEEKIWISIEDFSTLLEACLKRAALIHKKNPLKTSFARNALNDAWSKDLPEKLVQKVIDDLLKKERLVCEGEGLRLPSHAVTLASDDDSLRKKILAAHADTLSPPNYKDVLADLNITEKKAQPVLALLCQSGELIRVKDGLYYERKAFDRIMDAVRTWFAEHDNLGIADLKGLLGLSRKYLVALLEHMDNTHITIRVGDKRMLRRQ